RTHHSPNIIGGLLGFAWLLVILVPIYYIVVTSVRPREDYYSSNPLSLPTECTLEPFRFVLENDFLRYFANSVFVTVLTWLAVVSASLLASYVIVRSRTRLARFSQKLFLMGIAIPLQATIIPVYYLIVQLGLYDTLWALILPSIAFASPLTVLILTNFLGSSPRRLTEPLTSEGAGEVERFR